MTTTPTDTASGPSAFDQANGVAKQHLAEARTLLGHLEALIGRPALDRLRNAIEIVQDHVHDGGTYHREQMVRAQQNRNALIGELRRRDELIADLSKTLRAAWANGGQPPGWVDEARRLLGVDSPVEIGPF